VSGRYQGGAYVVFTRALNGSLDAFALKGWHPSVTSGDSLPGTGAQKRIGQAA